MILEEIRRNVFEFAKQGIPVAHCIASDLRMGAGIAVEMQKKFGLRGKLRATGFSLKAPTCVFIGGVFNLITKRKSSSKPTYESMRVALCCMRKCAESAGVSTIAMPRIGCGLDRLSWPKVRELIKDVFKGNDIRIIVCRL